MKEQGFREERSAYEPEDLTELVGQFRRFGEVGPAYEVLAIMKPDFAKIRVVATGEEVDYRMDRLMSDPLAETVP